MYFKISYRNNPEKGKEDAYYRLVESYRNEDGRVCHRTILNVGFLDDRYSIEHLNQVSRILTSRYEQQQELFTDDVDDFVMELVEKLWSRIVSEKRLDLTLYDKHSRKIDADTMQHSNVREIGAESICHHALNELKLNELLRQEGFTDEQVQLAYTQIISRAVYPLSELATTRVIRENSAVCELTGYDQDSLTKDRLYQGALRLYGIKDKLEKHLSHTTNELFDIQDKIVLYDLTNTYFEGQKKNSALAKFGRSKEKRSDAKIIVLALVVNIFGFIKYSAIHEGNMSDSKDLSAMIDKLKTGTNVEKPIVVMDAGIATEDNLNMIQEKGYYYLCVSRSKLKDYTVQPNRYTVLLETKSKRAVQLKAVSTDRNTDYYLEVKSEDKYSTEVSMKNLFESRFEQELQKIANAIMRKGGVKKHDKVHQRIGRARQKYPSVQKYYHVDVLLSKTNPEEVEQLSWTKQTTQHEAVESKLGLYFLRTNLAMTDEVVIWNIYNTIREIENTFRVLKTELDLRPVYHKTDAGTLAHLHLGLLAYWVVNTIRTQLKTNGLNYNWTEIVRIASTQKVITTIGTNASGNNIGVRKCSIPNESFARLQQALHIPPRPFVKRKSVVHKSKLQKIQIPHLQHSPPN